MPLLFLEFLGTTELLVIMVVALILFGPRRLPQIGHSIGKSLSEFKRASEDFKRTWETEVNVEKSTIEARVENALSPAAPSAPVYARGSHDETHPTTDADHTEIAATTASPDAHETATISSPASSTDAAIAAQTAVVNVASRKQDWL